MKQHKQILMTLLIASSISASNGFYTVGELASRLGISKSHAYKVNKSMRDMGLVMPRQSVRGAWTINIDSQYINELYSTLNKVSMGGNPPYHGYDGIPDMPEGYND